MRKGGAEMTRNIFKALSSINHQSIQSKDCQNKINSTYYFTILSQLIYLTYLKLFLLLKTLSILLSSEPLKYNLLSTIISITHFLENCNKDREKCQLTIGI